MELSSYVLEIPNDAHTIFSQSLIACSTLTQSRVLEADWLIMKSNETATLSINLPY